MYIVLLGEESFYDYYRRIATVKGVFKTSLKKDNNKDCNIYCFRKYMDTIKKNFTTVMA